MQFTPLALLLTLALAHIGAVGASPATRVQARAQCVFECVNDAECVDCPGVKCVTLGKPGALGMCILPSA
ncbi:uncharacterized protein TRAVEDRAFT_53489 [Trametes versicolor FP-101664 SS1]|uniref:uncharacterized protein n=1 Tax=Trametes versicolor (strain FP-101664) TaxID=717944 RepID=UPI0004621B08|nr:uncharacterized protein TRAVEDRAFT_53489 [Trametes versicolor FP-101664 SS1]EIW53074.1 hypothetical protein TRAVEDRAFT_53489 [Trametes versicolor FP-101664 SS1]